MEELAPREFGTQWIFAQYELGRSVKEIAEGMEKSESFVYSKLRLNGPEFTAKKVKKWLSDMGVKTLFIEPGSPWENGYMESFNSHMRDECLDREIFVGMNELRYMCETYRLDYNHHRPHQSLRYLSSAVFAAMMKMEMSGASVRSSTRPMPLNRSTVPCVRSLRPRGHFPTMRRF